MKLIFLLITMLSVRYYSQNCYSEWYTTDNGLPQNSVKDIVKDKYGYIWLSTENGILKYDGYNFSKISLGLNNLHFRLFQGDIQKDSIVIFNDYEKEGVMIKKRKAYVTRTSKRDKKKINGITYCSYYKRSLTESVPYNNYTIEFQEATYFFTKNLIRYKNNKTGEEKKLYLIFDPTEMTRIFCHGNNVFFADSKNKRIIKFLNGKMNIEKANPLYFSLETKFYWEQITNQVILINNDNIYISDYDKTLKLHKILRYENFDKYQFHSLFYDRDLKTLYLGSLTKGLNIVKPYQFSCVQKPIALSNNVQYAVAPFGRDMVITPDGDVFNHSALVKRYGFNERNFKYSMAYDQSKNILCINGNSLIRYFKRSNYKNRETIHFKFPLLNIYQIRNNYLLSMENFSSNLLLVYLNDTFIRPSYKLKFKYPVSSVIEYGKDKLLIGTQNGLFIFHIKSNQIESIGVTKFSIKKICRTSDGNIWIVSMADGIFLLRGRKLIKIPYEDDGLSSPHDILEDKQGFLWISTNNGIYKIKKSILLAYAKNKSVEVKYYRFSTKDGICSNEFNGSSMQSANKLNNGEFVFPSIDGLVFFHPENVETFYPKASEIFIERATINDSINLNFTNKVFLEKEVQKLMFRIDVPYYFSVENLCIEAKIDSKDEKWNKIDKDRTFTLQKLPPGDFTLLVRVLIDANGNYMYIRKQISIQPAFYQTIWFRISGFGLLLIVMIVIVIQQGKRINTIKRSLLLSEEKLKSESNYQEELFQAITHDIATPIKYLSTLSQMLYNTTDYNLQKKYFDSIYKSTAELYNLTLSLKEYRQVFNSEDIYESEEYFLYNIIDNKVNLFKEMGFHNKTEIYNTVPQSIKLNINRNILSIIFQNILDNSIKNTFSGEIVLTATQEANSVVITAFDTGSGMDKDQLNYYNELYKVIDEEGIAFKNFGLGLHLIIRLIKKIDAEIEFGENTPQGTIVKIKLKSHV